jgi:hypothetical protein
MPKTIEATRRRFISLAGGAVAAAQSANHAKRPGFERRGFYLHGSWVMNYPFAVRTWERQDFAGMFHLLRHLGFNAVMVWPTPETAPMPLSAGDARTLREYRSVIDDAHSTGLECWVTYCPSVIAKDEVRSLPWAQRSLYSSMQTLRLTDQTTATAYLDHRRKVLKLLDNADAFVVIDGDPGGYPGAPVDEYIRILKSDQRAVPGKPLIPWIWSGWGRENQKGGFWEAPVAPPVAVSLEALKREMRGAWQIMPGRSHREGWANGRIPVALAEKAGLINRSTIMCYEAIEFEPTPPAAVLKFDLIRSVLKEEGRLAASARGVFGNAQQPVMVLPNLYYFARGAADPGYLDRSQDEVLADLARALGGDPAVLTPAWSCLQRSLDRVPADLADRVRSLKLSTAFASGIPGGPRRYVEILAAQVASRRQLLEAAANRPGNVEEAAASLAKGASALLDWWQVHRYVGSGRHGDAFQWRFIHPTQVAVLRQHARKCLVLGSEVPSRAAGLLSQRGALRADEAARLITEL